MLVLKQICKSVRVTVGSCMSRAYQPGLRSWTYDVLIWSGVNH